MVRSVRISCGLLTSSVKLIQLRLGIRCQIPMSNQLIKCVCIHFGNVVGGYEVDGKRAAPL